MSILENTINSGISETYKLIWGTDLIEQYYKPHSNTTYKSHLKTCDLYKNDL